MNSAVMIVKEVENPAWSDNEEQTLKKVVEGCLGEESFETPVKVVITLTDDESIHEVNAATRKVDSATDVLSFPMLNLYKGKLPEGESFNEWDLDPEDGLLVLGDIMISLETAKRQAEEYGHSFLREVSFLTAHGMFHLLGYDHMTPEDEKEMYEKEEKVLSALGIKR